MIEFTVEEKTILNQLILNIDNLSIDDLKNDLFKKICYEINGKLKTLQKMDRLQNCGFNIVI